MRRPRLGEHAHHAVSNKCPTSLVRLTYFARICVFFFRTTRSNVVVNLTFYGVANAYSRCRKQHRTSYAKICGNHDFRNNRKFSSFGESPLVRSWFQSSSSLISSLLCNELISGHPGGWTRGHTRDVGNWVSLYFRSKMPRERPTGFVLPPPNWRWSWKHCWEVWPLLWSDDLGYKIWNGNPTKT